MNVNANIIARNPPSILFVIGGLLVVIGNNTGLLLIGLGVFLQVLWLALKNK
jgi:hypothetical protein